MQRFILLNISLIVKSINDLCILYNLYPSMLIYFKHDIL